MDEILCKFRGLLILKGNFSRHLKIHGEAEQSCQICQKKIKTNNALLPYSYFHMHKFLSDLYLVTGLFRKMPYKAPSQYIDSLQCRSWHLDGYTCGDTALHIGLARVHRIFLTNVSKIPALYIKIPTLSP